MDEGRVVSALDRAERALGRIERSLDRRTDSASGSDIREKVREAVAELDQLIREAAH